MTVLRPPLATVVAVVFLQAADPPASPRPAETYDLDIAEKRIHQPDFQAGSNLRIDPGDGGIHIQIGAGVSARSIDVVLRNVHGTVRFRADRSRLDALRSAPPPTAGPVTPDPAQQQ